MTVNTEVPSYTSCFLHIYNSVRKYVSITDDFSVNGFMDDMKKYAKIETTDVYSVLVVAFVLTVARAMLTRWVLYVSVRRLDLLIEEVVDVADYLFILWYIIYT